MNKPKTTQREKVTLVRQLGFFDSTMLFVGIVIGSGIFITTGIMAESLPSVPLLLIAWGVGGLLTYAGALIYAELGAAIPEAGGQYTYLREAYGTLSAFLYGWILFLVYITGSIAALGIAFSEYLGYFYPELGTEHIIFTSSFRLFGSAFDYSLSTGQLVAITLIVVLSGVNYFGVLFGKIIQNFFTLIKICTVVVFISIGLSAGQNARIDFSINPAQFSFSQIITGFGTALVAVSWAFDGWNNLNFVAGEVKDPQRTLPRSLFGGTLIITFIYLLVNYVYFMALPVEEMAGVVRIAERASFSLFGTVTTGIIAAAIMMSVFGALNGTILVGPRVYYAMARDGLFFKKVAEVHPKYKTPGFAIIIQAVWSCFLALTGTFEQLFTYVVFTAILFWIAAAASVITLRRKKPGLIRPYKMWGYPVVPLIFIVASAGILVNTVFESPFESISGIGLTVIGLPVYYYWKKKNN
jgi:APA family basic amino acid/polyamine antiporter